jgi:8-oxo-dGTP diphosphatase
VIAVVRPSAYAVIRNDRGEFAVVKAPDGVFLPGGGIVPGESPEQAVGREALEECGFTLRLGRRVAHAIQLAESVSEKAFFEKQCTFFEASVVAQGSPTEPGHELIWAPPALAASLLSHESHRWVVGVVDSMATKTLTR